MVWMNIRPFVLSPVLTRMGFVFVLEQGFFLSLVGRCDVGVTESVSLSLRPFQCVDYIVCHDSIFGIVAM